MVINVLMAAGAVVTGLVLVASLTLLALILVANPHGHFLLWATRVIDRRDHKHNMRI